ncbi:heavy metal transporter [Bdellovibrio sp. qaytius]|nr:heavy metal transporter [Bdellovibrio sp. qaytius]
MKKLIMTLFLVSSIAYAKKEATKPVAQSMVTSVVASSPVTTVNQIKVGVKGMVCAFCAQGIEKKFLGQKEVAKVEVSLENKFVKLTFKDGQSLPKEKIAEVLKEAGYEAVFE